MMDEEFVETPTTTEEQVPEPEPEFGDIDEIPAQVRSYLFCMLKNRCQKVSVKVCRKIECKYLEDTEQVTDCHCPTSMEYISAFEGQWKKRRKKEKEEEDLTNDE